MHVHILGICGTFMGGIAALARAAGHRVTGSDANVYPPMSTQLEALGIALIEGYEPAQLDLKPDVVVWLCEDRVGGFPSSAKLKALSQDSWLASSAFKDSHLARLLMRRDLAEGASPHATDFLAVLQPAEKTAKENESKFLYAVLADRELTREEREELPQASRLDVDESLRRDFFARTLSAQREVAELIRDRLLAMRLSSGKSGS